MRGFVSKEARPRLLHVVPTQGEHVEDPLDVDGRALAYFGLGAAARSKVEAFLDGESALEGAYVVHGRTRLPDAFVRDLERGGPVLRRAFPDLVRRVVSVELAGEETLVRVRCEGEQQGAFYRLFSATFKHTTFDVVHGFVPQEARPVHRISIDVRAIVTQLAEPSKQGQTKP